MIFFFFFRDKDSHLASTMLDNNVCVCNDYSRSLVHLFGFMLNCFELGSVVVISD